MTSTRLDTGYVFTRLVLPEVVDLTSLEAETGHLLPGGWQTCLEDAQGNHSNQIEIVTIQSGSLPGMHIKSICKLVLTLDRSTLRSPRLAFLTYALLERDRQLSGMATIHASAAVTQENGGILILGDKGSGKTNTLLALLKQGCRPAGDDLLVLRLAGGGVKLLPGKRIATIRGLRTRKTSFYEDKQEVKFDNSDFLDRETPIALVARVNIHSGASSAYVKKMRGDVTKEILRLHENVGRYISGLATPFIMRKKDAFGRVLHLDNDQTALFRSKLISRVLDLPFYYVQAKSADEAAIRILALLGKERETHSNDDASSYFTKSK